MNKDTQIREDIERELLDSPGVNAAAIGVSVKDGVVTLTGKVGSYSDQLEAIHAAERIRGVKAVACELSVDLLEPHERTDADIAQAASNVVAWNSVVPSGRIRIAVTSGWVRLEGTVDWQTQKHAAVSAVAHLLGVRGVENLITVNPLVSCEESKGHILDGLKRTALVNPRGVIVEVSNDKVRLYGEVRSLYERDEAERVAWSAPGVSDVANHLSVREAASGAGA